MNAGVKPGGRARDLAVEFTLMLLLSFSMASPFVKALDFKLPLTAVALLNAVFLALLTLAFRNRATRITSAALFAALAAFITVVYLTSENSAFSADVAGEIERFRNWTGLYLLGNRIHNPYYTRVLAAVFCAVICVVVYQFTRVAFDPLILTLCGAACFASLFIIGHDIHMPALYVFIATAALYAFLHSYRRNRRSAVPGGLPGLPSFMFSALPLAVLALLAAIALSVAVPLNPGWMKEVREELLTRKANAAVAGVAEGLVVSKGELGGNITLSDAVVMEVTSPVQQVYLRSGTREIYTGHSWERLEEEQNTLPEDAEESREGIRLLTDDEGAFGRLFPEHELAVRYRRIPPGKLLTPLKTEAIRSGSLSPDEIKSMRLATASPDMIYTARFLHPQSGSEEFRALAAGSRQGIYERQLSMEDPIIPIRLMLDFCHNSRENHRQYVQLPDTVTDRVRNLADEITAGLVADFEQAAAIRDYLAHHFSYTLTPGQPDRQTDFVDQFLFGGKRGYCTYFATAMAVLLRCKGIPCRYVEGYVLPPASTDGVYLVTGRQGHAWVEAYFEGLGWLTFDPTTAAEERPLEAGATATPFPTATPERTAAVPTAHPVEEDVPAAQAGENKPERAALPPLWPAFLLLALPAAVILNRRSLRRMEPSAAVPKLFARYMAWLEGRGAALANGEPVALFAERVDRQFGCRRAFARAAEIYQRARFSDHEITAEHKQQMVDAGLALLGGCRKKPAFLRRLIRRWIWGI